MNVDGVELLPSGAVSTTALEQHGPGLRFFLAEPRHLEHSNHVSTAGAIDQLPAGYPATRSGTNAFDQPSARGLLDRQREFVVDDCHTRLQTLLFGEYCIQKLVDVHLVTPVRPRRFREVGELASVHRDNFGDQFPPDTGDDLLAPCVEETGKSDTPYRRRTAKLTVTFEQDRLSTRPGRLDCRNRTGRPAANDQDIRIG